VSAQKTILVVDDDPATTDFIVRLLASNGYRVLSSSNTEDAFALVHKHGVPDLIVADVVMPGMDGRELGHWMQAAYPKIKVLFISGHPPGQLADPKVLQADAAFLKKPFQPAQMLQAVRDLLAK
jgi:two-component system, cell cycle sensor histidine kinase and response regulator CckA